MIIRVKGFFQKYIIAILLVLIAANAGYSIYLNHQRNKEITAREFAEKDTMIARGETAAARSEAESLTKSLELTRAELNAIKQALEVREDRIEQINKEKEASDAKLKRAISNHPDWGSIPVPDSVLDALR